MEIELKMVESRLKALVSPIDHVWASTPISNAQNLLIMDVYNVEAENEPLQRTHLLFQELVQCI
jgi:hypothetical protein